LSEITPALSPPASKRRTIIQDDSQGHNLRRSAYAYDATQLVRRSLRVPAVIVNKPKDEFMRRLALMMITSALLAAPLLTMSASAQDSSTGAADSALPDATVSLDAGSVAIGIGYVWGHGKVDFQNTNHNFSISGLSLLDVGGADISATGYVYHLTKLADFAGTYTTYSAGVTIAGGGSAAYMKNEHGVVIKLTSTTQGLRFNLATSGVTVKLKS
jgi:hypothetical protein